MELIDKLSILADAAKYDASCASSGAPQRSSRGKTGLGSSNGMGICHSFTPDGRCVSLLKVLLTNFCLFDCQYCVNRRSSNVPRARFTPEEVVRLTLSFYRRNTISGLFLSSGIIRSSDYTMEQLIQVARLLRETHQFRGYIHLKAIPEADPKLLEEAGRYADRLSANIELPTLTSLKTLAPEKELGTIHSAMGHMRQRIDAANDAAERDAKRLPRSANPKRMAPRYAPGGQSTQMIVGADATDDRTILQSAQHLYRDFRLKRVYYSAFSPIPERPAGLPQAAPPLLREHRLYQADFLIRGYGFRAEELLNAPGNLDLEIDPKLAWALAHRDDFPVDLNRAEPAMIARVPGIGLRSVQRLVDLRRLRRIRYQDLVALRCRLETLQPFVVTQDYRPTDAQRDSSRLRQSLTPAGADGVVVAPPSAGDTAMRNASPLPPSCAAWANDFDEWRAQARRLLHAGVPPASVTWHDGNDGHDDLFSSLEPQPTLPDSTPAAIRIGRDQLTLLGNAARYRADGHDQPRWPLLYRVLWRWAQGDAAAMHPADRDGRVLHQRWHAVKREAHHMHAFLRFHRCDDAEGERYVAWFEPAHDVLDLGAEHFADRMGGSRWIIATPHGGVGWDGSALDYRAPCPAAWAEEARTAAERANADEGHALWRTYFVSTFNPARLNHRVMTQHMPQRFWRHLSEGDLIPALEARARHGGQRLAQESSVGRRKGKALPGGRSALPQPSPDDKR